MIFDADNDARIRIDEYVRRKKTSLHDMLGAGVQGTVHDTTTIRRESVQEGRTLPSGTRCLSAVGRAERQSGSRIPCSDAH